MLYGRKISTFIWRTRSLPRSVLTLLMRRERRSIGARSSRLRMFGRRASRRTRGRWMDFYRRWIASRHRGSLVQLSEWRVFIEEEHAQPVERERGAPAPKEPDSEVHLLALLEHAQRYCGLWRVRVEGIIETFDPDLMFMIARAEFPVQDRVFFQNSDLLGRL